MGAGRSALAPILDSHAHVFTRRLPLADRAASHPAYEYPAEAWIAELDRHGVTFGVVAAASLYGDYNDYTLDALKAHKRLRGTVIASPSTPMAELKAWADAGIVGVRLAWRKLGANLPDLTAFEYQKFLRRLADLNLHVQVLASAGQLPLLLPTLDSSGVRVVIDHFGGPELADGGVDSEGFVLLLRAIENGRTWVKLSAAYRVQEALRRPAAERLLAVAGPERLLWGSDAPFVGFEKVVDYDWTLRQFEALTPDPAVRRAISDTGLKFYFS
jgi:predicted TIM-barrel fold metal-dependent hydrolase